MMQAKPDTDPKSPLSILVVDDDELNRRMMQLLLKREGYTTDFATNGQEALDAVKSGSYDIVLMDLQMPVMDGVEASRRIREWEAGKHRTFIVALTASFMPEKGRELFEVGIDNYLSKPFEVDHLRNILQYGSEKRKTNTDSVTETPKPDSQAEEDAGIDFQLGILRVGNDREVYRELLGDFVQELPEKLEKMQSLFKDGDWENLYRAAHNLKGVSANLGALQLSEHAGRLEKQVKEGYNETVEDLLSDILVVARKMMKNTLNLPAAGN